MSVIIVATTMARIYFLASFALLVIVAQLHLAVAVEEVILTGPDSEGTCPPYYVGDGYCDSACNVREHRFDDGDCCEYTCVSRARSWPCGSNGYNCLVVTPAPSWFTRDTQLCYKWRADGNGGQCGNGVANELCAHVDHYTTDYRDDTDSRGGGCRMQWKIR